MFVLPQSFVRKKKIRANIAAAKIEAKKLNKNVRPSEYP